MLTLQNSGHAYPIKRTLFIDIFRNIINIEFVTIPYNEHAQKLKEKYLLLSSGTVQMENYSMECIKKREDKQEYVDLE